jgi:VWFA-related protein
MVCLLSKPLLAKRIRVALFGVLAVALPLCAAQDQLQTASASAPSKSDVPKFSSEVKVVNLLATVRDKKGKIINDLSKDDFQLEEDGRQQTIKYFTRETDLPLKLGLLVDTSGSVRQVLPEERTASQNFLDQVVREDKDAAFLIHFDRQVELLQDFTSSREKLQSSIGNIEPSSNDSGGGGGNGGGGGPYGGRGGGPYGGRGHHGGGTLLYDAIYLASDELMQKQTGRKALILLTDGEDNGSKTSLSSAIEAAQRADTLVYGIYFKGEEGGFGGFNRGGGGGWGRGGMGRGGPQRYPQPERPDGKKVLEQIAKQTGGRIFEVSKKQSVDQIYAEIQEELRNQYSIGYTPNRDASASTSFHKIHLVANKKDVVVQTREGYYDRGTAQD